MVRSWGSIGVITASLVGCGPTYGIVIYGELTPELWEAMGDEPAKLYARVDDGLELTQVVAAYCPGDEALDQGISPSSGDEPVPFRGGCMAEMGVEVWMAPDSAVPRADGREPSETEEATLDCEDRRRLIGVHDTTFTSDGWPSDRVSAFEGMDGSAGLLGACSGSERREVVLD